MLPAIVFFGLAVVKTLGSAELAGRAASRSQGYRPKEGPMSEQVDVKVSLDSEHDAARFTAIAAKEYPEVFKGIVGKTYRMTTNSEYEELKVLALNAMEFAGAGPEASAVMQHFGVNREVALLPLAQFFHNFPQARVK